MKRIILVLLVLSLFGAGLSAQNIKIGVIQDLSGPGSVLGSAGLHGARHRWK